MGRAAQLVLSTEFEKKKLSHGGSERIGKRKVARPISAKSPMHLVLRSTLATGTWSLLRYRPQIDKLTVTLGKKFGVQVYRCANSGNHLHLVVRPRSRNAFTQFVTSLAGRIAQLITGARKGKPLGKRFF